MLKNLRKLVKSGWRYLCNASVSIMHIKKKDVICFQFRTKVLKMNVDLVAAKVQPRCKRFFFSQMLLRLANICATNETFGWAILYLFQSLDLSHEQIGDGGAQVLAIALKGNTTLLEMYLSSNEIGVAGAQALANALEYNVNLQRLDLSYNYYLGNAGAKALAKLLDNNAALKILDLHQTGIGVEGAQALGTSLESNATLRCLILSCNAIGDKGALAFAKALGRNTVLQHIDLCLNEICDKGAQALAKALERNTILQRICLNRNLIGDEGAQAMAEMLRKNATLRHVRLEWNQIGDLGEQAIRRGLQRNATVQHLGLWSSNQIGNPIEKLIRRNKRLQEICGNRKMVLKRTISVAIAMCSIEIPIYVLLEIVEWESAMQMADAELDYVEKRFLSMESHRQRCESTDRKKRAQTIQTIYKHHKDVCGFAEKR